MFTYAYHVLTVASSMIWNTLNLESLTHTNSLMLLVLESDFGVCEKRAKNIHCVEVM